MKRAIIVLALAAIVTLPFALRPKQPAPAKAEDTVVIITPHNEAIRYEYARGFQEWYRARTGQTVAVDWRVIGGTSEIARFLESEYVASFHNYWTGRLGKLWTAAVQAGFQRGRIAADASVVVTEARAAFLESSVGCGIDVFFGGGTYDLEKQATAGRLVDSGMLQLHPDWFTDRVIPRNFAGETFWDKDGLWFGTVLSSYGIIFDRDSLQRLGFKGEPQQWTDLADPRLVGEVALADPTKSGSIAKAFENIIQQQMQRRLRALRAAEPAAEAKGLEQRAAREGWLAGMKLLQLIGANARYFTDSSQKAPIDVAAGNCAAGLCIDFYGRQQQEAVRRRGDSDRIGYLSPAGGSVASVDPIALLRGAPHRAVAVAFIEYSLSMEGQKLWDFKPGAPGGPRRFALRRLPVRFDFYGHKEWRDYLSDPDDVPFAQADQLVYRPEWTDALFRELAFVVRVMCQDTHVELARAWQAIIAASEPAKSRALAELQDLTAIDYDRTRGAIHQALGSRNKVDEVTMASELGAGFRRHYAQAEAMARRGD
jgi:iron(III) transport system substrate-binding protein